MKYKIFENERVYQSIESHLSIILRLVGFSTVPPTAESEQLTCNRELKHTGTRVKITQERSVNPYTKDSMSKMMNSQSIR